FGFRVSDFGFWRYCAARETGNRDIPVSYFGFGIGRPLTALVGCSYPAFAYPLVQETLTVTPTPINGSGKTSRRDFLKTSAAAVGATLATQLATSNAHASGSDVLRIGLIGCGGRGTGAAAQALNADKNVKLVAMGDMFADRLKSSLAQLKGD